MRLGSKRANSHREKSRFQQTYGDFREIWLASNDVWFPVSSKMAMGWTGSDIAALSLESLEPVTFAFFVKMLPKSTSPNGCPQGCRVGSLVRGKVNGLVCGHPRTWRQIL